MSTTLEWKTSLPLPGLEEAKPQNWYERFGASGNEYLLPILIISSLMMSSGSVGYITASIVAFVTLYLAIMPRLPIRYRINSWGITERQGVVTLNRKRWSEIDSFRILMPEEVVGVVVIEARKGESQKYMCLFFDERNTSSQQIRAALAGRNSS